MRLSRHLLCGFLLWTMPLTPLLAQGESPSDPTIRHLEIPEIVRRIEETVSQGKAEASVLVWAVDVDTLWKTGMRADLADTIAETFSGTLEAERPRMAVAVLVGSTVQVVGKVTRDPAATAVTIRELDAKDPDSLRDIMGGLRRVAAGLPVPADAVKSLDEGIAKVVKALARAEAEGLRGLDPRGVAVLETLEAQLRGARFNQNQLSLFCDKILAEEQGQDKPGPLEEPLEPEKPSDGNPRKGLQYSDLFFCHGTAPIRQVRWLGGEAARRELQELCDTVDRNLETHRRTPFEIANRRIALAVFEARWFST